MHKANLPINSPNWASPRRAASMNVVHSLWSHAWQLRLFDYVMADSHIARSDHSVFFNSADDGKHQLLILQQQPCYGVFFWRKITLELLPLFTMMLLRVRLLWLSTPTSTLELLGRFPIGLWDSSNFISYWPCLWLGVLECFFLETKLIPYFITDALHPYYWYSNQNCLHNISPGH